MAKRTRYPGRLAGSRPAVTSAAGGSSARASGLTAAELERAAALEAELVAGERAAVADNARRRARVGGLDATVTGNAGTPLSVRAAQEYAYVARDVRRIGITAAVMFGILAILWVAVNLGGVTIV